MAEAAADPRVGLADLAQIAPAPGEKRKSRNAQGRQSNAGSSTIARLERRIKSVGVPGSREAVMAQIAIGVELGLIAAAREGRKVDPQTARLMDLAAAAVGVHADSAHFAPRGPQGKPAGSEGQASASLAAGLVHAAGEGQADTKAADATRDSVPQEP